MKNNKQKTNAKRRSGNNKFSNKDYSRQNGDDRYTKDKRDERVPDYSKNDASWYGADSAILRDYASYPFSFATGTPIKMNDTVAQLIGPNADEMVIPGITIQWLQPSIGFTTQPSDPVNVAMNSLYSAIRSVNSGAKNYDAPDQFMYCVAVASIYSYINWMQRIYGIATTLYSQGNRYMPEKILNAEYIDYTSIRDNVSNFRGAINMMINKVASFAVPSTLSLFKRMAFLYQGLYSEGSSIKDQLYMYSPFAFYKFQLDTKGKGMLNPVNTPATMAAVNAKLATAQELVEYGNDLIDALFSDEDVQIMGGDILKAYGINNLITLSALPEVYPIVPVFSIEVLEQMANADVIHDNLTAYNEGGRLMLDSQVTQVVGDLPTSPYLKCNNLLTFTGNDNSVGTMYAIGYASLAQNKFLTTTTDKTDPALVIVNSRLMCTIRNYSRVGVNCSFTVDSGTEIAWAQCYVTLKPTTSGALDLERYWTAYFTPFKVDASDSVDTSVKKLRALSVRNFFKFNSPIMEYAYRDGSTSPAVNIANGYLNQAIDNATLLHSGDIQNLHQVAILNLLHVPAISKR